MTTDFYTPNEISLLMELYYSGNRPGIIPYGSPKQIAHEMKKTPESVKAKIMETLTHRFQRDISVLRNLDLSEWTEVAYSSDETEWYWHEMSASPLTLDQCRRLRDAGHLFMAQKRVGPRMVQMVKTAKQQQFVRPMFTENGVQ